MILEINNLSKRLAFQANLSPYQLIKINDGLIVIKDQTVQKEDGWCYHTYYNRLVSPEENLRMGINDADSCWKVMFATPNLKLQGVPTIEEKDTLSETWDYFKEIDGTCDFGQYEHFLYDSGYKKAKENSYTKEECIGFYFWLKSKYGTVKPLEEGQIVEKTNPIGLFELYLNSTKRVELEFDDNDNPVRCILNSKMSELRQRIESVHSVYEKYKQEYTFLDFDNYLTNNGYKLIKL